MRLVSDVSGRFKDLEVLREEKLTKTLRKMTNSLSLRQCHFSKQCNLLFSKYFEQIFSSPVNQIRDAFSLYLDTVQRGKREPESQKDVYKRQGHCTGDRIYPVLWTDKRKTSVCTEHVKLNASEWLCTCPCLWYVVMYLNRW